MQYLVKAFAHGSAVAKTVYRTSDYENATCFAESYFMNRAIRRVHVERNGAICRDKNSREWIWRG